MNNIFRHIKGIIGIKDKKGQSDVVFEVLIAVILLGFVLVAGTLAMSSLSNTKCSKSIDISLSSLKQNIEKASTNTLLSTEFLLDVPYCFGSDVNLEFKKELPTICSIYCPGVSGACYMLKYQNSKDKVSPVRFICLQVSPVIVLNAEEQCVNSPTDFDLWTKKGNNSNGIKMENGRYIISSSSALSNNDPTLCIYKKESR